MTDETSQPEAAPKRRRRRPSRRGVVIAASIVAVLVATPVVVNELTPRPYVGIFRALIGTIDDAVTLGPLEDRTDGVVTSDPIAIPVEGAPDAGLTIHTSDVGTESGKPVILLIHGGGWVVGSASQIGSYADLLASAGFVVANLSYSLAPEEEYPTPILQSAAALDYLHEHAGEYGGDGSKLFVGGNSAGAQISSQLGAVVADPGFARQVGVDIALPAEDLRGVILYSGPYDFDTVGRDDFPGFRTYAWSYLGQKDYENDPRLDELSTTRTATADYPATYLTSGDADPLEPQSYQLDAVLRSLGVEVTSRYWTGSGLDLPHDYVYELDTEAARTAFDDTVAFVERHAAE